jgi:hypothetical protein
VFSESSNGATVVEPTRKGGLRGSALSLRSLPIHPDALSSSWSPVLVVVITVVGLLVRLPSFGDSLFGDEVGAYWIVTGHGLGRVIYLMSGHSPELNPPLWFIFAWASEKLFGASPQSLKLVSLLAGTATIPLTYLLGRWTVGVRAGLVAAMVVALSPFLIFYSTEARPYALLVLLCLLSTLALLQALRTDGRGWWAAYAVFSCAAAYTHFTAVFLLVAQLAWAFVTRPQARRPLVVANGAAAIGFLPWLPELIKTSKSPGTKLYEELEPFGLHAIRIDLGHWSIGHPFFTLQTVPGEVASVLALVGVAVAALGVMLTMRAQRVGVLRLPPEAVLAVVLAFAAPVGTAIYSDLRESVWGSRNLISSWPGFAVLLGGMLIYARAPLRAVAVGLIIAAYAIGAVKMTETSHQRPDYESAAAYIDRIDQKSAPVVDLVAPTPGPPTATEAALALDGAGARHPVLRIGLPPLTAVLKAAPYAQLATPSGEAIAREASALAGTGLLFIVAPTSTPIGSLESARRAHIRGGVGQLGMFASFLGALPARFHPITSRTYPGFAPVTVYVYRG